jgi:hypothetical protein
VKNRVDAVQDLIFARVVVERVLAADRAAAGIEPVVANFGTEGQAIARREIQPDGCFIKVAGEEIAHEWIARPQAGHVEAVVTVSKFSGRHEPLLKNCYCGCNCGHETLSACASMRAGKVENRRAKELGLTA